mgnify:CR=1 FL=1
MTNLWLFLSGVFGFLGVGAGAFGAHALKTHLPADLLTIFETGSRYCLIHAVALMGVAIYYQQSASIWANRSAWCFSVGIVIFSGSLWTLALTNTRWLGAITPIGGGFMLLGWIFICIAGLK